MMRTWKEEARKYRRRVVDVVSPLMDVILLPLVLPAGFLLKIVRRVGLQRLRLCRAVLMRIGVLPIRRHYYEPLIVPQDLRYGLDQERELPGIDWNVSGQLAFLSTLTFHAEFADLLKSKTSTFRFEAVNDSFGFGDAEYLYQIIRRTKPARMLEIGSGQSTLVARAAIEKNCEEDGGYRCEHVCIEPYEAPWLESLGIKVLRQRMEEVERTQFDRLESGDLLFIDSSHVIRPQGDVLTAYLEILPRLRSGVIVHVHDVFSPRDYLDYFVFTKVLLWNEQYLLEAFLTHNREWEIIGALNFLKHTHFKALQAVCPFLTGDREPGSFYIKKK
jgi:hypothetical protein